MIDREADNCMFGGLIAAGTESLGILLKQTQG